MFIIKIAILFVEQIWYAYKNNLIFILFVFLQLYIGNGK